MSPPSGRYFVASNFPSLLLGSLLVPTHDGTREYLESYFFLFGVAWVIAISGRKKQSQRLVRAATLLLWLAPFLPIAMFIVLDSVLRDG